MARRQPTNKQYNKGSLQSTTYANMSDFVRAISAQYNLQYGYVIKDLDKITQKTAKEMAAAIRERSPVGKTGEYAKGWTVYGQKNESGGRDFTVYNDKKYMLTHLLEYSHFAGRDMHIVQPHRHIEPVVTEYNKIYIERITKAYGG